MRRMPCSRQGLKELLFAQHDVATDLFEVHFKSDALICGEERETGSFNDLCGPSPSAAYSEDSAYRVFDT
jgi:hypothetical protein